MDRRLLIISNNPFSYTNNNGKTILSFIESLPYDQVRQLYFSGEVPSVPNYEYFQLSDRDVIKGRFHKKGRGRQIQASDCKTPSVSKATGIKRNAFTCLCREMVWYHGWVSPQLEEWLDDFSPTAVFFVAGDCVFAYKIYEYVVNRFCPRASLYLTDDYIMSRENETGIETYRRRWIIQSLKHALNVTDQFFTVSEVMRRCYKKKLKRDSAIIVNMTESLRDDSYTPNPGMIRMIYAGSLYYGRDDLLQKVADVIIKYNHSEKCDKKVYLDVFTNSELNSEQKNIFHNKYIRFNGSVGKEKLKMELNRSDIPLFVESFEKKQIEKTRLSLSTKVPEYLSLHKPIFAVGPSEVGSMQYLEGVAMCVNREEDIYESFCSLMMNVALQKELSDKAESKFRELNNKQLLEERFLKLVFGEG